MAVITIPFDVAKPILNGLDHAKGSLRLVILEDEPTQEVEDAEKRNKGQLAFSNGAILGKLFTKHKGSFGGASVKPIPQSAVDQWFIDEESVRDVNAGHVFFVHSKFLLVDPLSPDPLVASGSANFSTGSLINNDENMLLIRSEQRVADIYLTEFDRIFRHFYARNWINREAQASDHSDRVNPLLLDSTQSWVAKNFQTGTYKNARRLMFFPEQQPKAAWFAAAAKDPDAFADEGERARNKGKKVDETSDG